MIYQFARQFARTSAELFLWAIALTLVTSLTGCSSSTAQQAAQQESGTQSECILTSNGNACRSPNGISTPN